MTENFDKNMKKIQEMMVAMRNEKYAIVNSDLTELDEFTKNLYLKVLCTVLQYENEPSEMQILFLKRIVNGMDVEEPMEEYLRRALEISEEDMGEFFTLMKENKIKYYFAMDGLLLAAMGDTQTGCYEYLAEVIELMGICKDDLDYICLVASAALQQQSSLYDEAKGLSNERVERVDYAPYIRNFYAGAIKDSRELVHFSAPDRKYSKDIAIRTQYTEKRVVLENLDITILETWAFDSCEEVIFENCHFSGEWSSIKFYGCHKVYIHKCRFTDFRVPVFIQEENLAVQIEECEFENCIYAYTRSYRDWQAIGGVIHTESVSANGKNVIRKTRFRKCGGKNTTNYYASAIISNCICKVDRCSFYDCWNYNCDSAKDPDSPERTLFLPNTEGSDNEIVNSAKLC